MGVLERAVLAPERADLRNLVTLLLDTSESMGRVRELSDGSSTIPINELSAALKVFIGADLPSEPVLRSSGELAIGEFSGSSLNWLALAKGDREGSHPFYFVGHLDSDVKLEASGQTPMATAILVGLQAIERRKEQLRNSKPPKSHEHRPVMYLVTDGQPEGESKRRMEEAIEALQEAERLKKVLFFSLGTGGADMDLLRTLSIGGALNAFDLKGRGLSQLLKFVSRSAEAAFGAEGGDAAGGNFDKAISDPRDARHVYEFVNSKFEKTWWDSLSNSGFAL
jgi:uncharacterized protein YegL